MSNSLVELNEAQSPTDDLWSVAQGVKNGRPLLIRYRSERPHGVEATSYPLLLSATWSYCGNELGLPAPEESELMAIFEDALASALEASQSAYLMVVLTGNGERDWLWYSRGEADSMSRVNNTLKGHRRYPVEFSIQRDRAWRAYSQFQTSGCSTANAGGIFAAAQRAISKAANILCRERKGR